MSNLRQPPTAANSATKAHRCVDCATDISHRRRDALRCQSCAATRDKKRKRQAYLDNRTAIRQAARDAYWQDRTPVLRCLDCGADISHRKLNSRLCESCSANRNNQHKRRDYQNNREKRIQASKDYYRQNRPIVLQRIKRRAQTPDGKRLRQEWERKYPGKILEYRRRTKQKHREKTGYNPVGRTCIDCGTDISLREHNAKKCVPCSTPPPRTCTVCQADISNRGARAEFCSTDCKHAHQHSKEVEGYTKACTKCGNTKAHTEFGMHNNLRRSVCKICEVKSQSERYKNFTQEQRERRRSRRHQLAQVKRTNQSSEEKAAETAKLRKALRKKHYGPDFDEDKLYAAQEGKCALCGTLKELEEFELDHDHETGVLRGYLCKNCNFKLLPRYERFPLQCRDSPYLNAYLLKGNRQLTK